MYGNIVCRCETVTEGEIVESIRRSAGARNLMRSSAEPGPEWDAVRAVFALPDLWQYWQELHSGRGGHKERQRLQNSNGGEGVTMHNVDLALLREGLPALQRHWQPEEMALTTY